MGKSVGSRIGQIHYFHIGHNEPCLHPPPSPPPPPQKKKPFYSISLWTTVIPRRNRKQHYAIFYFLVGGGGEKGANEVHLWYIWKMMNGKQNTGPCTNEFHWQKKQPRRPKPGAKDALKNWNTNFRLKHSVRKKQDHLFSFSVVPRNSPLQRPKKVVFHLLTDQIFQKTFVQGKQPMFLCRFILRDRQ